jgi:ribosomal protein L29
MKKAIADLKTKSIKQLELEIGKLREEIAKLKLEIKINQPKDTNLLFKKRKQLARMLTVLTEKKELERIKNLSQK